MSDNTTPTPDELPTRELLPCPFCGGPAYYHYTDAGHDRRYDRVHCKMCDARIGHPYTSKDKARAAWNTRTHPAQDAQIEGLEEALAERVTLPVLSSTRSGKAVVVDAANYEALMKAARLYAAQAKKGS